MPPLSGKKRKAQLKLKRAIKRGDVPGAFLDSQKRTKQTRRHAPQARLAADHSARNARSLQSQFVKLDKGFLELTRTLAGSIVLRRSIQSDVVLLRQDWFTSELAQQLSVPKRPRWRYQMSKEELDANEQAYFRTWLAQQDTVVDQWQRISNPLLSSDVTDVDDSETHPMPRAPTHFERNIEVWRQFWRVTEISQVLLVLLDSRCPPLHLPRSLSDYLAIPTSSPQTDSDQRPKQSLGCKAPRVIFVLTKVDISGPERASSWSSFLAANYPDVPIVPVEAYAPKSHLQTEQGPTRYEPHLPGTFRERLVHTLRNVHQQLLQPPERVTAPRTGETEQERVQRIDKWTPRVKRVIDWDAVLYAKGNLVGKAVGGAAVPKEQEVEHEGEPDETNDFEVSDSENEQTGDVHEWKEPEFLTVGVIGQPNVGKSSLLNAIFGTIRVRASRTPGKTKHFQTLFWTSDVRLVDCPGLVMPSFVPMDTQVLSGVLPISRVAAVPFCVHQLARLLPLEQILELTHPSLSISSASTNDRPSKANARANPAPANAISDKRTWRPGQRPLEQTKVESSAPTQRWTANDIMTAYANMKGWVTAKAGRPDIHRAGNAILRLVAEGKIPWAFWPPGSSASSSDGIWLKDQVHHAWDEPEIVDEDSEEEDSDMEELSSEEEEGINSRIRVTSDEEDEDEDKPAVKNLGRFEALSIDDEYNTTEAVRG